MNTHAVTTIKQFRSLIASHATVLVNFTKDHCSSCKMLALALTHFATRPLASDLTLTYVQLEQFGEEFFRQQGLRQTPTLILYRDGLEAVRLPGFYTPVQIETALKDYLLTHPVSS